MKNLELLSDEMYRKTIEEMDEISVEREIGDIEFFIELLRNIVLLVHNNCNMMEQTIEGGLFPQEILDPLTDISTDRLLFEAYKMNNFIDSIREYVDAIRRIFILRKGNYEEFERLKNYSQENIWHILLQIESTINEMIHFTEIFKKKADYYCSQKWLNGVSKISSMNSLEFELERRIEDVRYAVRDVEVLINHIDFEINKKIEDVKHIIAEAEEMSKMTKDKNDGK